MVDDLEKRIRAAAPSVRPPGDLRQNLKNVLRLALEEQHRPRRFILPVSIAAFLAFFLIAGNQSELGSGDFSVEPIQTSSGYPGFRANKWQGGGGFGGPGATKEEAEQVLEWTTAGARKLVGVTGLRYAGETYWSGIFEYDLGGEIRRTGSPITGDKPPSREISNLVIQHDGYIERMVNEGHALFLGVEEKDFQGTLFRLEKWEITVPGFGKVIYLQEKP